VFAEEAQRFDLQWAIVDNSPQTRHLAHLDLDPAWTLVHASRRAIVFVRTDGVNAELARARGYRWLWPTALEASLVRADQLGHGREALRELHRMVAEDPENPYPSAVLDHILSQR
jgi:hypothetical protein